VAHFLDPQPDKTGRSDVETARRLLARLRELIETSRTQGFWGSVSLEVFLEDGVLVRFREQVQRTHKP
jgi:hypothetical protein